MNEDEVTLQEFGYKQLLERNMKGLTLFAASFAYISILTGVFQTFNLGFNLGGPAFVWGWVIVLIGNTFIALNFAELSAHYPLSGGVYHYSKYVASPFWGWLTGWTFLACNIITLAAVPLALQNTLPQVLPVFQIIGYAHNPVDTTSNAIILAIILLIFSTFLNSFGQKILLKINNALVLIEIFFLLLLLFFLFSASQRDTISVIFETSGRGEFFSYSYFLSFLTSIAFSASYILYGYDTAATLAEETISPTKYAPKSILLALLSAGLIGGIFTLLALKAAPDLTRVELGSPTGGLAFIFKQVFPVWMGKVACFAGTLAIISCTFAVHSNVTRLIFSMARDNVLPFSNCLCYVSPKFKSMIFPPMISGGIAIIFLLSQITFSKVFEMVVSLAALWANLSYFIVICSLLCARLNGWPKDLKEFSLGKSSFIINIIAFLWVTFMVVNLAWPRPNLFGTDPIKLYSGVIFTIIIWILGIPFYYYSKNRNIINKNMLNNT